MQITMTRSQLVHEAAEKLQLVGTGQVLEAEYQANIDARVDPLLLQLGRDGIVWVANDDAIPGEWFDCLAALLANVSAPLGGKAYDPQVKQYFENMLKRVTAARPGYSTMEVDYF